MAHEAAIELTVRALSGEVLATRNVSPGHSALALRSDLAATLGFPPRAVTLLSGDSPLPDDHTFLAPDAALTCIFAPPEGKFEELRAALIADQPGFAAALLRAAPAPRLRELLLSPDIFAMAFEESSLRCCEALVEAAEKAGLLSECLFGVDHAGRSTLFYVARDDPAKVALLLATPHRRELLVAEDDKGNTALHYAASSGCLETVEPLLLAAQEQGVLEQLLRKEGWEQCTPLHEAARLGRTAALKALLEDAAAQGGKLLEELLEAKAFYGQTVQEMAARAGNQQMLRDIEEAGRQVRRRLSPDNGDA